MKRLLHLALIAVLMMVFTGCKENYSVGEKVGNLIEFTKKGVIWDSWEGRMNYQAQVEGWKVKLKYHAVWGMKNVFSNRGETDYFVDDVEVLDKDFANPLRHLGGSQGRVVDTVWVVVDKAEMLKHMNK